MSRRVVMIATGVALAVMVIWYFILWSPASADLEDARERTEAAEDEADLLQIRLQRLQDLQDRAPVLQSRLEELRAAVPDTPDLARFILESDEAANRSGIDFVSISPSPPAAPTEPGGPAVINVSINALGGYFQTLDFLNRLADLDRVIVIDTLSVSASTQGGIVELNATISGRLFVTEATLVGDAGEGAVPGATTTSTVAQPTTTSAGAA